VTGSSNYTSLFSLDKDLIISLVKVLIKSFLNKATTTNNSLVSKVASGFCYNRLGVILLGVVITTSF